MLKRAGAPLVGALWVSSRVGNIQNVFPAISTPSISKRLSPAGEYREDCIGARVLGLTR